MEWNDDIVFSFVKKIQSRPCLWNPSDKNKKNRNKVHDAFKSIAEEMGTDNIGELKKKKENLFQTYRSYRRKVFCSQKSGAGTDDIYKPTWPPYSLLDDFLQGVYAPKERFNTLDTFGGSEEVQNDDEGGADNDNKRPRTDLNKNEEAETLLNINKDNNETTKQPVKRNTNVKPSKKAQDRADVAFTELLAIKEKITERSASCVNRDECTVYAELLAIKLRKLDERTQRLAMHKIDPIMFDLTFDSSTLPTPRSHSSLSSDIIATPSPSPSCSYYSPQPPHTSTSHEQSHSNYITVLAHSTETNPQLHDMQLQCSAGPEDEVSDWS